MTRSRRSCARYVCRRTIRQGTKGTNAPRKRIRGTTLKHTRVMTSTSSVVRHRRYVAIVRRHARSHRYTAGAPHGRRGSAPPGTTHRRIEQPHAPDTQPAAPCRPKPPARGPSARPGRAMSAERARSYGAERQRVATGVRAHIFIAPENHRAQSHAPRYGEKEEALAAAPRAEQRRTRTSDDTARASPHTQTSHDNRPRRAHTDPRPQHAC